MPRSTPAAPTTASTSWSAVPAIVPRRAVAVFLVVTFAAVWIVSLPLWQRGGDVRDPAVAPFLMIAVYAPALGVLVAALVGRQPPRHVLAATGMAPLRPLGRLLAYSGVGLLLPPLLAVAALFLSARAGGYAFHDDLRPPRSSRCSGRRSRGCRS